MTRRTKMILKIVGVTFCLYEGAYFASVRTEYEIGSKQPILGDLRPFSIWVAKELGFTGYARGWCGMITERAGSDEKALDMFF